MIITQAAAGEWQRLGCSNTAVFKYTMNTCLCFEIKQFVIATFLHLQFLFTED